MRGFPYVLLQFILVNLRQALNLVGWALALTLVLASASVLLFLPLNNGRMTAASQHLFVLMLDPLLSEGEINRLAWQIAGWPETLRVNFRFAGETDPEPLAERALVVEARPEGREALLTKLTKLVGVRKVTALERRAEGGGLPSRARLAALAALALGLGATLFLGQRATKRALSLWRKEREILRLAGLGPLYWQGPLLFLGLLAGLAGAGLFALALHLGLRFLPPEARWGEVVHSVPWLTGVSFPIGALLGFLASLTRAHS